MNCAKASCTASNVPYMSRWSASAAVTTAMSGDSRRNERSYSSASTARRRPPPRTRFEPKLRDMPPRKALPSPDALWLSHAARVVVVVLPWVPATAMTSLSWQRWPSICERFSIVKPSRRNHSHSLWSAGMAGVYTTIVDAASRNASGMSDRSSS